MVTTWSTAWPILSETPWRALAVLRHVEPLQQHCETQQSPRASLTGAEGAEMEMGIGFPIGVRTIFSPQLVI